MQRVEAVVQTGPVETRYVRAGRGAPVLLLFNDDAAGAAASQLLEAMVSEYRLVLPALDGHGCASSRAGRDSFCAWLRDFMDGLGIDRFAVIAASVYAGAIAAFTATDPDRIEAVIVLGTSSPVLAARTAVHVRVDASGLLSPAELSRVVNHLRAVSAPPGVVPAEMD
jgi:pimeloyl-ACP methyl ester carboxylesterase